MSSTIENQLLQLPRIIVARENSSPSPTQRPSTPYLLEESRRRLLLPSLETSSTPAIDAAPANGAGAEPCTTAPSAASSSVSRRGSARRSAKGSRKSSANSQRQNTDSALPARLSSTEDTRNLFVRICTTGARCTSTVVV